MLNLQDSEVLVVTSAPEHDVSFMIIDGYRPGARRAHRLRGFDHRDIVLKPHSKPSCLEFRDGVFPIPDLFFHQFDVDPEISTWFNVLIQHSGIVDYLLFRIQNEHRYSIDSENVQLPTRFPYGVINRLTSPTSAYDNAYHSDF